MKKALRLASLVLLMAFCFSFAGAAYAADMATITFTGKGADKFAFGPGSEYTDTDLFPEFKDMMPGDRLTQTIRFKNEDKRSDYVKLYMKAISHDPEKNPISMNQGGELKEHKGLELMQDFLSQLTLRVYNTKGQLISEASAEQTAGLTDFVYLGKYRRGAAADLKAELEVPFELGNEYANRAGEVDWVFQVETFTEEHDKDPDPTPEPTPAPVPVPPLVQTGQLKWPIPFLAAGGLLLIVLGLYLSRRQNKEQK